jgi:hypothetical protein
MDEAPIEGSWYETDTGEVFMVVKADAASGLIDVQYLDGKVDQFDRAIWAGLDLIEIEPADEWRETMDEFFRERGRKKF